MAQEKRDNSLLDRLTQFATDVLALADGLPDTQAAKHLAACLVESSMQPAFAYVDAQQSKSREAFIGGLRQCLIELQNTLVPIYVLEKSRLLRSNMLTALFEEADHLTAIFIKSITTAEKNNRQ